MENIFSYNGRHQDVLSYLFRCFGDLIIGWASAELKKRGISPNLRYEGDILSEVMCKLVEGLLEKHDIPRRLEEGDPSVKRTLYWITKFATCEFIKSEKHRLVRTIYPSDFEWEKISENCGNKNENEKGAIVLENVLRDVASGKIPLSKREKKAFLMKYAEGKSIDDIANCLGIQKDSAKRCLRRAQERVRNFYGSRDG